VEESRDQATRLAFRQMAKGWARLAFSQDFTSPTDEGSEASKNAPSEKLPILTEPEHRTSDSDAEKTLGRGWFGTPAATSVSRRS
jgi:hypothetical protein